MNVQPYLFFDGKCDEALAFYKSAVGAEPKMLDKTFNALAAGGQVTMPMAKTFFSPRFGMLTDKFGVGWMVLVPQH
jgi:PhnB protein